MKFDDLNETFDVAGDIVEATKVIDATPQDIQDAMRHIPMRS